MVGGALDHLSGHELGFHFLIGTLAMLGLWEYYTMLDHKHLPNFKIIGMICGGIFLVGSFLLLQPRGAVHSYDFEVATLLFFLLVVFARQMFQRTRDISPLETMAYTLFGLFYVIWMFGFVTKIVYVLPRDDTGHVTGHLYVLFLILVTKFSDMGAYLTGSVIGKHLMVPHISPRKRGRVLRSARILDRRRVRHGGAPAEAALLSAPARCGDPGPGARPRSDHRRPSANRSSSAVAM